MNIEQARFNMIEQQIRTWDVLDQTVLDLLSVVKREEFVPAAYRSLAFVDMEIPLVSGQNMLMPKFEARILQELAIRPHEVVLEIGTGSGYMAALLAHRGAHVTSVEIFPALATLARENLARSATTNVTVVDGDGAAGWPSKGTIDVIVISGSVPFVPDSFLKQLTLGGRLAAIVGDAPAMTALIMTRTSETSWETDKLFETCVQPLVNAVQPTRFSL